MVAATQSEVSAKGDGDHVAGVANSAQEIKKAPQITHQVVIVGAGAAGITTAASLRRKARGKVDIAIIDPAEFHYYQPAFTLVGAGSYALSKTQRPIIDLIPKQVNWYKEAVIKYDPANNRVILGSGKRVKYDYLIVCAGLSLNWADVDGALAALGKNHVCSNYSPDYAQYTWSALQAMHAGAKLLFTQPPLPFKCPGAPQKIAYLAADYLKKKGILDACEIHFLTHAPGMFGVPFFAKELKKVADKYGINVHFQHNLTSIDHEGKKAAFEIVDGDRKGEKITMEFDLLHVTPPQSTSSELKSSELVNAAGYVDVHQHTLQHTKYNNIFSLGDACSTPNSKTAAAVRKQAPVVVRNVLTLMQGGELDEGYDGYGSCPLTTAYGKVIMAEFIYGGKVTPTFPLDPRKERWANWWMKASALPVFYWRYMLKGREWFFRHNTDYVEPV